MREGKRQRTIQVRVDRQCEIPELQGDESLEDMTLATEIASFTREGDVYVLEGYIEIIGYAAPPEDGRGDGWTRPGGFLFDAVTGQGSLKRIQERLPYQLRVRAEDQEEEVLHVKTKLGSWDAHVLGAGSLHLRADLIVEGFSATGYYFRCGDQEEGFWPGIGLGELSAADGDGDSGEANLQGCSGDPDGDLPSFQFEAGQDPLSSPAGLPGDQTGRPGGMPASLEPHIESAAWVSGDPERDAELGVTTESTGGGGTVDGMGAKEAGEADDGTGAAHGIEAGAREALGEGVSGEPGAENPPEEAVPTGGEEAGESPDVPGSSIEPEEEDRAAVAAVRAGQERADAFAWSKLYSRTEGPGSATLTFRQVQEEESLVSIAEEYRVSVGELMRLNGLSQEAVHAGQWLVVPGRRT
ncbi:MAG: LysM peptidoglycan-binding domain-containing protein [Kyrpidia sp.]|nr:LysM peptidoglycan-binding domain-containing protein [Kyrpidia sp.]